MIKRNSIAMLLVGCSLVFSLLPGCTGQNTVPENLAPSRETLVQVSTIDAVLAAVYDGVMEVGALRKHGDFGIGTFDRLEGEMVVLDGKVFQIKADGVAYSVTDDVKTPFATVTYFDTDRSQKLAAGVNLAQLTQLLDKSLPSGNMFYAIKIEGSFSYMRTRSVPAQNKPYPPLVEVTKNQSVFEMNNVAGTVVGFYCPPYVNGINAPGYHLHFLTRDGKTGGHILDLIVAEATAALDDTPAFLMLLPGADSAFYHVDLAKNRQEELKKAEK